MDAPSNAFKGVRRPFARYSLPWARTRSQTPHSSASFPGMHDEHLADEIDQLLGHLFEIGAPKSGSMREPAVIASMLIARTRSNFNAMRILIGAGHHQEAHALFRCLLEAAICLCAMDAAKEAFVADFISHTAKGALNSLVAFPDNSRPTLEERTTETFGERGPDGSQHRLFNWYKLARDAEAGPLYKKYVFYSNVAVHVSGLSLSSHPARRLTNPEEKGTAADLSITVVGEAQYALVIGAQAFCEAMDIPYPEALSDIASRLPEDMLKRGFIRTPVDKPKGEA